jgi:hypothetical protein
VTEDWTKAPDIDLWFKYRELKDKNDVQANTVGNEIQRRHSMNPQKYTLQSLTPSLDKPTSLYNMLVPEYEKLVAVPNDTEAKYLIKYYKQSAEMEGMSTKQIDEADSKAREDASIR